MTEFHPFVRLPVELQLQIWEESLLAELQERAIIQLEKRYRVHPTPRLQASPLFATNHQSRNVAKDFYPLALRIVDEDGHVRGLVHVSLEYDIFFLNGFVDYYTPPPPAAQIEPHITEPLTISQRGRVRCALKVTSYCLGLMLPCMEKEEYEELLAYQLPQHLLPVLRECVLLGSNGREDPTEENLEDTWVLSIGEYVRKYQEDIMMVKQVEKIGSEEAMSTASPEWKANMQKIELAWEKWAWELFYHPGSKLEEWKHHLELEELEEWEYYSEPEGR
ncbi:hypothetical protein F4778DRAFT_729906 [Xylariomycetidae sp. FL2044]|nr:hypothetical protein F4778DRAFT_729906 [Xylariomycetidae sp. FL2044]